MLHFLEEELIGGLLHELTLAHAAVPLNMVIFNLQICFKMACFLVRYYFCPAARVILVRKLICSVQSSIIAPHPAPRTVSGGAALGLAVCQWLPSAASARHALPLLPGGAPRAFSHNVCMIIPARFFSILSRLPFLPLRPSFFTKRMSHHVISRHSQHVT